MGIRIPKETTNLVIVERYKCTVPECREEIPRHKGENRRRYFQRAYRHSKIPVDRPIPNGFVFIHETEYFKDYHLIVRLGKFISGIEPTQKKYTHTYEQDAISFEIERGELEEGEDNYIYRVYNSKHLKELLKSGTFRLLSEAEFKEFQRLYEEKRHVYEDISHLLMKRTTPELEKLLAQ